MTFRPLLFRPYGIRPFQIRSMWPNAVKSNPWDSNSKSHKIKKASFYWPMKLDALTSEWLKSRFHHKRPNSKSLFFGLNCLRNIVSEFNISLFGHSYFRPFFIAFSTFSNSINDAECCKVIRFCDISVISYFFFV